MKKTTFIFLIVFILASLSFESISAETLLVKYDFNGGSQTPSYIADGIVSSGLGRKGTDTGYTYTMAMKESRECLVLTTSLTSISSSNYVYIPIVAAPGKMVKVTKTVITHRKATGNTTTGNARSYLFTSLDTGTSTQNLIWYGSTTPGGYPLGSNTTWMVDENFVTRSSNLVAPFYINTNIQYASFGFAKSGTGGSAEWWIDEIAFYGTVVTEGAVNIESTVDFGDNNAVVGNPVVKNFSLNGYNVANDVTVTIEGNDAAMFTLNDDSFTAKEVNAGTTFNITYAPTTIDAHTANMKFTYGAEEANVSLKGSVGILYETFDTGDMTGLVDKSPLNDLAGFTVLPGWSMENVVKWQKSGLYSFAPALESSLGNVAQYSTPGLDLSKPYKITVFGKNNGKYGQSYILAGQDTICYYSFPINYTFAPYTVDGFVATDNTKIAFTAVGIDDNYVVYDNILISNTSSPTVSLPLMGKKEFGSIFPNATTTIKIPLKAYNLSSDLTVSVPSTSGFELLSSTIISKENAQAGTEISVKFKPTALLDYTDMIQVSGGGLPSSSYVRTIYLVGHGSLTTQVNNSKLKCKLVVEDNNLHATVDGASRLEVYSFNGVLLKQMNFTNTTQTILSQGVYLVRINSEKGVFVQKVFVR